MNTGFSVIPNHLLESLNKNEILVYVALRSYYPNIFPSHEALARRAGGLSVSTVQRTLKSMREKGLLEWQSQIRKSDRGRTSNVYLLRPDDAPIGQSDRPPSVTVTDPLGHGDRPPSVMVTDPLGHGDRVTRTRELEQEELKNTGAHSAPVEEEDQVPTAGSFPDDPVTRTQPDAKPPRKKKSELPTRGTHAYIVRKIENGAVKAGQRTSTVMVKVLVKRMREEYGWSYREMEFVVDRFFVGHADAARGEGDVVKRMLYWLPRLEKETKQSIDNFRKGWTAEQYMADQEKVKTDGIARAKAMIAEEKKRREQAV